MQKNYKKIIKIVIFTLIFVNFIGIFNANALGTDAMFSVRHSLDGCGSSLLGNPNDPDSVAWLLQYLLNAIKVVGPILVIVLSSVDFLKVIIKSDDDAMAAATKKLGYRLILAGLLFFIPTIVEVLLGIFGITSDPTCGIQ